jgi:hypothetical protein
MKMDEQRLKELGAEVVERKALPPIAPDPSAPVIYTDSVQVRASIHDIMLYLGLADPADPDNVSTRLVGRVIMSPQHAKALTDILVKNVEVYEAAFGPIPTERRARDASGGASDDGTQDET